MVISVMMNSPRRGMWTANIDTHSESPADLNLRYCVTVTSRSKGRTSRSGEYFRPPPCKRTVVGIVDNYRNADHHLDDPDNAPTSLGFW
jgi:hypothetical protein